MEYMGMGLGGEYDPIGTDQRITPMSNDDVKFLIKSYDTFFDLIFEDVKDDAVVSGPTERFGLTKLHIKSFNFGRYAEQIQLLMLNLRNSGNANPSLKFEIRKNILEIASYILSNDQNLQNQYSNPFVNTFTPSLNDRKNRHMDEVLKHYDLLTRRHGKLGVTDYEIKFSCRSKDDGKSLVFIDSEGTISVIPVVKNEGLMADGIYVCKRTPSTPVDEPFLTLPLPTEGDYVKCELANVIFFNSLNDLKNIYKRNFDSNMDTDPDHVRKFNIKKILGRLLYNGVTETSHGLVSVIIGFSLNRKSFWTCSHDGGVEEIINICESNMIAADFQSTLGEYGINRDILDKWDIIVRKTNIGPGTGMVSSKTSKMEKIRIPKSNGINEISNKLMDTDLSLFNEAGIAIFSSREAAERCMTHGGGDIEKYIKYLVGKIEGKTEKRAFVENLKNAALIGAGAAVPKVLEFIMKEIKDGDKMRSLFKMTNNGTKLGGIMKPMIGPMANINGKTAAGIAVVVMSAEIFGGLIGSISGGFMEFITGIKNYFTTGKFVEDVKKVGNFIIEKVKYVGAQIKSVVVGIYESIKGFFTILTGKGSLGQKAKDLLQDIKANIIKAKNWVWDKIKGIFNFIKSAALGIWNFIKKIGGKIIDGIKSVFNWFKNLFTGGDKGGENSPAPTTDEGVSFVDSTINVNLKDIPLAEVVG